MRSCETCRHTLGGGYCFGCNRSTGFHKWEPKPMTNYDRLISKTPEELADFLVSTMTCTACRDMHGGQCPKPFVHVKCRDMILGWLKSPVEVDE